MKELLEQTLLELANANSECRTDIELTDYERISIWLSNVKPNEFINPLAAKLQEKGLQLKTDDWIPRFGNEPEWVAGPTQWIEAWHVGSIKYSPRPCIVSVDHFLQSPSSFSHWRPMRSNTPE